MKLWQKIFICTLFIVMTAVSLTGILILRNNYKTSIDKQIDSTYSEHEYMISNINNKIIAERIKNNQLILPTKQIIIIMNDVFNISDNKESTYVQLFDSSEHLIYQNSSIYKSYDLLPIVSSGNVSYKLITEFHGKHYLLIGSKIVLEKQNFIFITASDISDVYNLYSQQLSFTKILSVSLSLFCAFVLLILVKVLMKPLNHLNIATHAIAAGDYSKRISHKGKDEIGELANNMNLMASSIQEKVTLLQETSENRKLFINNLSHEMKTPLTSILGFADIMRIKRNITHDELIEYSNIIFQEASRLKNLSGKLMELITVGETILDFTNFQAKELFSQLKLVLLPTLEKNNITLETSYDDCYINIDSELFKSMLFNIIENAIKASAKGDTIQVTGKYITEFNRNSNISDSSKITKTPVYEISIIDHGIGIKKEDLDKITEPFFMVDKARSRKAGGAGLGLALCKKIADIHHADFEISSIFQEGTTVKITIPSQMIQQVANGPVETEVSNET